MRSWTVVLLRPQRMCDYQGEEYGKNVYVALIQDAQDTTEARIKAQMEVHAADCRDLGKRVMSNLDVAPRDYGLCVMFRGIHQTARFGWEVPTPTRSET